MHGTRVLRLINPADLERSIFVALNGDLFGQLACELTLGALHGNVTAIEFYFNGTGHRNGNLTDSRHWRFSSCSRYQT